MDTVKTCGEVERKLFSLTFAFQVAAMEAVLAAGMEEAMEEVRLAEFKTLGGFAVSFRSRSSEFKLMMLREAELTRESRFESPTLFALIRLIKAEDFFEIIFHDRFPNSI